VANQSQEKETKSSLLSNKGKKDRKGKQKERKKE
jgi:hypothetical protein